MPRFSVMIFYFPPPKKNLVSKKATDVSMDVNDNDVRNGNMICDGGKGFQDVT